MAKIKYRFLVDLLTEDKSLLSSESKKKIKSIKGLSISLYRDNYESDPTPRFKLCFGIKIDEKVILKDCLFIDDSKITSEIINETVDIIISHLKNDLNLGVLK